MIDEDYFLIGDRYCDRIGWYEIIDKKENAIKRRYEDSGEESWIVDGLDILIRIHKNIQQEISAWWVCHHEKLWAIDDRLIGFWRKPQWDILNIGNTIVYYRIGQNQVMGVFKIIKKEINLNPNFYCDDISERTKYQCRLELLSDDIVCEDPRAEKRFSFYKPWSRSRWGGLKIQVYPATKNDLKLIMGDPSSI
ncbi:MAG: hypothetical protein ACLP9S_10670 [Syntrophales bacterium]